MGVSATRTTSTSAYTPSRPTGIAKRRTNPCRSTLKPRRRSLDRYFWYTALDGTRQIVNSNGAIPAQVNDCVFTPAEWRREPYPSTFTNGGTWPPREVEDILCTIDADYIPCVGSRCYTQDACEDINCTHSFTEWRAATADWEKYFELRMTDTRGIGVFTKKSFRAGSVLGWYAGELKTMKSQEDNQDADYLMEMDIGDIAPLSPFVSGEQVYINAKNVGNWTRFINHCCSADCVFGMYRVGDTRIMVVETVRDVKKGKELSVDYGKDYYGLYGKKVCACGVDECVSKKRERAQRLLSKRIQRRSIVPPHLLV